MKFFEDEYRLKDKVTIAQ